MSIISSVLLFLHKKTTFKMSEANKMYRNPDPPVGYTFLRPQEKTKMLDNNNNNFLFLSNILEAIKNEYESDTEADQFVPNSSSESESIEENEQNDAADTSKSPIKEEKAHKQDKTGAKKKDAVASSSSSGDSPTKSEKIMQKKTTSKSCKSPKRSKTSIEKKDRRDSGSSSDSSHYSRSKQRRHSRSASPKIKQEYVPEHLFGCYHCDVCNLTLNSKATYDSHVIGKRHKKAYNKALNIVETVARSVSSTNVECKKPMPPSGIVRIKVKSRAYIQPVAEKIKNPLPGLQHVTEIRAFSETSYYCSLCNAPCSGNSIIPHLGGFKHMLRLLKHYRPDIYDKISYKQKYQIEDYVRNILENIEAEEGRGQISVEEEKFSEESAAEEYGLRSFRPPQPSTSQEEYMDFNEYYNQTTIPDTSKSGFYCTLCEAHMNSKDMWNNHINGKRHLTNARKTPGSIPSKNKTIPMKNVRANLMDLLEDVDTPVVGLDHIKETQNRQTRKDMYQCYLCGSCLNTNDIVDHVVSHKHRIKYLQEINHECLDVVKDMDINGPNAFAIVEDACATIEAEFGRGKPNVFFSKDCFPPIAVL